MPLSIIQCLAICKLLSSDYDAHKLAPQHDCHWYDHR